jgi:tRNA threonylcarbamoyladenosine biosynthesis protein TsaB
MKILALEFSTNQRSVAVVESGAEFRVVSTVIETTRKRTGISLLDQALVESRVRPAEIDVLAVGLGPGSYAGIRSAIALSQGWQLARGTRLLGISSVDVIAAEAQRARLFGEVHVLVDAQRREFYHAKFAISESSISQTAPLQIISTPPQTGLIVGPELPIQGAANVHPAAPMLGKLAASRSDFVPGEELEPIYLRPTTFLKAAPPRFARS